MKETKDNLILGSAKVYRAAGLSVIPTIKETKAPALKEWKTYQQRLPTYAEIEKWFRRGDRSLGIVCGKVSGHLEVFDFDQQAELFDDWASLVNQELPGVLERLTLAKTQNFGRHVAFRCPEVNIPGNLKLAMRAVDVTAQVLQRLRESKVDLADKPAVRRALAGISIKIKGKRQVPRLVGDRFLIILTFIETRGEGGMVLAAPSPGYDLLQGDFSAIPEITAKERQVLIEAALSLNEWVDSSKVEGQGSRLRRDARRPGDDFNQRGDVASILEKHGWTITRTSSVFQHWRRPGKKNGQSASLINERIFYVFSHNAPPFEANKAYSPFAVYALLEHGGDYSAAARELVKQGFGQPVAEETENTEMTWPEPEPLRRPLKPGEPFPVEALGPILGEAAAALHEVIKAPQAICCQSVLAVANLAVQAHADIMIDGRSFPLSEFFISIALSGDRKTSADQAALTPVINYQKDLLEEYKKRHERYEREYALWKVDYDEALKRRKTTQERRIALEALPPAPTPPFYPQLTTEEPTYEGIVKLLQGGRPALGLFSDESGRFFGGYAMSPEQRLKTMAGLSALWDGRLVTRTRVGDGSLILYGRRFCAHFLMQPLVAETILGDPLAHDQGFLSRCLIVAPQSTLGRQHYSNKDLTEKKVYQRYCQRLSNLLRTQLPLKIDPITKGPTNELIPRSLGMAHKGKELWVQFHDWVQDNLHADGIFRPISGIAAKAAEHALRLAGTMALVDDLNTPVISRTHIKNGITLAHFYLIEALRLFHTAKTNPDILIAEKVLEWLRARESSERNLVSLPEVYQFGPNMVRDKTTALRIMQILTDHNWVRPIEGGAKVDGRFRRQVWKVHPHVFQDAKTQL